MSFVNAALYAVPSVVPAPAYEPASDSAPAVRGEMPIAAHIRHSDGWLHPNPSDQLPDASRESPWHDACSYAWYDLTGSADHCRRTARAG